MNKIAFFFLICSMVGCSSSDSADMAYRKNECVTAGAAYQYTFQEKSGTCGPLQSQIAIVPEDGMIVTQGCTNKKGAHYDGCSVYTDAECEIDGLSFDQHGKMNWNQDGSSGKGIVTTNVFDICTSTYELTATRL